MKIASRTLFAAAAFAFASTAFAASPEFVDPAAGFVSSKTRAEVTAEIKGAQPTSEYAQPEAGFASTKTRAQVRAELEAAIKAGELRSTNLTY
jgi:hypothetical protein